jgi:hypothetical protein
MSTVEEIFEQIEGLTFSDKILVLADLAKKIQKGVNKNVKLSKEEKEAKPKKVMPPNPWNAFIAHMLTEKPEMFVGVEKRSEQIKIISAYKKENEDEYEEFIEEFRIQNPKPVSAVSDEPTLREGSVKSSSSEDEGSSNPKPKRKYEKKAKVEEKDDVPKTKVVSVSDKAAEIKKKLAEKKASETKVQPKVSKVEDFDPFETMNTTTSTNNNGFTNVNPFGEEEEENAELVDKVVKGKKYKFDPKTNELYDENFTIVGKFNPKLKSQIEEIE